MKAHNLKDMTWKELSDKISSMTQEEQQQDVAIWGEDFCLRKQCALEKKFRRYVL